MSAFARSLRETDGLPSRSSRSGRRLVPLAAHERLKILTSIFSQVDLKEALAEKSVPIDGAQPGMALRNASDMGVTSYSRVAGFVGATVIATFFWALGNIILYKAFVAPAEIRDLLSSLVTYFLSGASLFLPYAFNQLRSAFT